MTRATEKAIATCNNVIKDSTEKRKDADKNNKTIFIGDTLKQKTKSKDDIKLEKLLAKRKEWLTKQKRAENAVKKLNKRIKYYERKIKK